LVANIVFESGGNKKLSFMAVAEKIKTCGSLFFVLPRSEASDHTD
jgi:hypothetical protein